MKKSYLYLLGFLLLGSPLMVFAHGDLGDDAEHHEDEIEFIEPCEEGSVIKCGTHGEDGYSQTLEKVVNDLLVGFNVESVDQLDCEEIVEHDFGHVGESLMSYMHPNEEEHERIDEMMGGEGSESLEVMHIAMGKRYLGCDEGSYGPAMMGFTNMMNADNQSVSRFGRGMFGGGMFSGQILGNFWWYPVVNVVVWLFGILGVVYVVKLMGGRKK